MVEVRDLSVDFLTPRGPVHALRRVSLTVPPGRIVGVSTYVGTYFFDGSDTGNVTGVSSRTQGQVNEDLTVGVQISHDSVFDTDVQMQVTWTLPDGGPNRWMRQPRVRDRLTAPVARIAASAGRT